MKNIDLTNTKIELYCAIDNLAQQIYNPQYRDDRLNNKGWDDFTEEEQEGMLTAWNKAIKIIKKIKLPEIIETRIGISLESGFKLNDPEEAN
jgi:hypothetical protein